MITIAEPREYIDKLWGKQKIREGETYRLMRYVLRVDHEDKVLLHNVVTGRLVVLEREEAEALASLPAAYSPAMEQLAAEHFLVSEACDEYQQVVNLRAILRTINATHDKKRFRQYVILPTTLCNARCYYCFEQGIKSSTMSVDTANDVVEFIASNYDNDSISIMWFGGEPTVACDRIDQISEGLREKNIQYTSTMISNGYLFDEKMAAKARALWNLKRIQITVDGMAENYNKIKNYVNPCDNPFERVMRNIGLLLDAGIRVDLRMNFDKDNYMDFQNLVELAQTRFHGNALLQTYAYPVIGEYPSTEGAVQHGSDDWAANKMIELNAFARESGAHRYSDELPYLTYIGCGAEADTSITINAQGYLSECPERFDDSQTVGTVKDGILNTELVKSWKVLADYPKCVACPFYPRCMRLRDCTAKDNCRFLDRNAQYQRAMITRFSAYKPT